MPWVVAFARRAVRDLGDLEQRDREAVEAAIGRLALETGTGDLRKLSGRPNEWRLRVGRWRVILELDNAAGRIVVVRVLPRNERTYRG
jgi:mRNA-degrading endonuclease RelE of RelBE toxin-antitoxin system